MKHVLDWTPLKCWCKFVLPTVYDDSLSYYELLCKIIKYINDMRDDFIDLINDLMEIINNITGGDKLTLTFEMFGAKGDGKADDSEAIKQCVNFANQTGMSIVCLPNKEYVVNAISQEVDCNINFNGSSVIMPPSGVVFTTKQGDNYNINSSIITQDKITGLILSNKSFSVITTMSMGHRYNSDSQPELYYAQHMCTDADGNFTNTPWYQPETSGQTWLLQNVMSIQHPIKIENVHIVMNTDSNTIATFLACYRNNVHVYGVVVEGSINVTSGNSLISFNHTDNCSLKNVQGNNINKSNSIYGYLLNVYCCSDMFFDDIHIRGEGWGWTAMTYVSNINLRNSNINRIDVHYNWYGYFIAENINISGLQSVINIGGMGYGMYIVRNCTINKDTVFTIPFINIRNDVPPIFDGKIIIEDCIFKYNGKSSDNAIGLLMQASFNVPVGFTTGDLDIVFSNCKFYNITTGSQFSCIQDILNHVNMEYNNVFMNFGESTKIFGIICTAGRVINKFIAEKYYMDFISGITQSFSSGGKYTEIKDSYIAVKYANAFSTSTTLVLINDDLIDFGSFNTNTNLIIQGCRIYRDAAFSSNATNKAVNGNIIVASTKTNLASWNNVSS